LWLETPINPFGTHFDIQKLSAQAHSQGAIVAVDATFAPPPLMDPFKWGTDYIMHSATKYLGGHSDLLAGCIVTKSKQARDQVHYFVLLPFFWGDRGNCRCLWIGFMWVDDLGRWRVGFFCDR
jgi:cystathionine beta-lyase/cystathionine gamma-synthase